MGEEVRFRCEVAGVLGKIYSNILSEKYKKVDGGLQFRNVCKKFVD